jgi:hypothetical protein
VSRLFLSHSSANNAEAVALRDWLKSEGWDDVFIDLDPLRGIAAGERWERALNQAASRCEAVLFVISRAWLSSRWCLKEFNLAHRLNKRLFGILIEDLPDEEIPADLRGNWQLVQLGAGRDHIMRRVTMPITGEEAHVTFSAEGLGRLKSGLQRAGLDARFFEWPPSGDPNRSPYRGLRPLGPEDAGIFFGRDAPIIEALDQLRGLRDAPPPRCLVIIGASGAGKSSFLRAGLWPRLARDDQTFLPLPIIRPGYPSLYGENGLLHALEVACVAWKLLFMNFKQSGYSFRTEQVVPWDSLLGDILVANADNGKGEPHFFMPGVDGKVATDAVADIVKAGILEWPAYRRSNAQGSISSCTPRRRICEISSPRHRSRSRWPLSIRTTTATALKPVGDAQPYGADWSRVSGDGRVGRARICMTTLGLGGDPKQ